MRPQSTDTTLADRINPPGRVLCLELPTVAPELTGAQVAHMFERHADAPAFAVVAGSRPVGLIDRLGFMSRFASLYGRDLYGRRPVTHLMDPDPLAVEIDLPLERISYRVFATKPKALQTGFILLDGGGYAGIAAGIDLLRAVAESLEASNATLRQTQAELIQSEKMAALGGLVAGIAHEINTPIGSALTAATAFGERAQAFARAAAGGSIRRSEIDRFVGAALQAVEYTEVNIRRAGELINSFKQVAVDQTSDERRAFHLRQCLDDVLLSLQPRLRKDGIAVAVECPTAIELDSYPGAIAQIVTNLVLNAVVHAFDEELRAQRRPAVTVTAAAATEPGRVCLTVADNGRGIPERHLSRIFDPFFTTRRGSGGTGLGLHIVYNLVTQRLGGTIGVESTRKGAVFTVTLPEAAP